MPLAGWGWGQSILQGWDGGFLQEGRSFQPASLWAALIAVGVCWFFFAVRKQGLCSQALVWRRLLAPGSPESPPILVWWDHIQTQPAAAE